jgi:hypothetical protein
VPPGAGPAVDAAAAVGEQTREQQARSSEKGE